MCSGVPYQPLMGSEFGAWGSAMIAGKAAGIYDDLAEVAYEHAIPAGVRLTPDRRACPDIPATGAAVYPVAGRTGEIPSVCSSEFTDYREAFRISGELGTGRAIDKAKD